MTDTKQQLENERAQLAARSLDLGKQLALATANPPATGNEYLDNLASRSTAQIDRHKQATDDAIYVIDQRLQLLEITDQVLASLQPPAPVE